MSSGVPGEGEGDAGNTAILDACVVINLAASRQMAAILDAMPGRAVVAEIVVGEALYVQRGGAGEDAGDAEPVDLTPVIQSGRLQIVPPTEEELEMFVDLAIELDDGEAMTLALAIHRGYTVATDDRKVSRVLASRAPLRSTLDLVKTWAEREAIAGSVLRTVLTDLRERGGYLPGRAHPLRGWWDAILSGG